MSGAICAAVTELPVFPERTVNPGPPERMAPRVLRERPEPRVFPALQAPMARQARMELLVDAALPERRVLRARLALRERKALRAVRETGNVACAACRRRQCPPTPVAGCPRPAIRGLFP